MSCEATAWARKTCGHKTLGHKLLLMVLADYADPDYALPNYAHAWPSQQTLAQDCEISERSIRRYLVDMEAQGFISLIRKGKQCQPTLYRMNLGVMEAKKKYEC
jgi:hypothetical protein